ncbi:unnamed protein product [Adineta steineri]|uniref:Enoyl reductase (ER) domain-containing protein n=2 Tax=Adineta steineri TaxID=433720 RepID=A0A814Y1S2_9BILA|nr:unnamed protein product [Adineta steineri]CAF1223447.1 unnamed protein product [Adineta steineri]
MVESTTTTSKDDIPSLMTAAHQNGYGEAGDVLTLAYEVPVPRQLSSNQILVRVYAASINPIDWKLLNGNLSLIIRPSFPHIPGKDVAGVVINVGSSVKRLKIGDQVYGNVHNDEGAYAEYVRGKESQFALKPNNLTMIEAAAIPLACETSYQALFTKTSPSVGPKSKVFICGGASATGWFAIQMAKAVGAHVATTCSQRNFSLMEKLGYKIIQDTNEINDDPQQLLVIDYNNKDFGEVLQGQNYDLVYDCVGGEQQWLAARRILKRGGQFITIAGDDPEASISLNTVFTLGPRLLSRKLGSVFGSSHHSYMFHMISTSYSELDHMRTAYFETGKVKLLIDTVFDWQKDGVQALHKLYEKSKSGKAQGKLILKIADE